MVKLTFIIYLKKPSIIYVFKMKKKNLNYGNISINKYLIN